MKVSELLERRRPEWQELETLCRDAQRGGARRLGSKRLTRLAELYRARCADLALAEAYQLPQNTVSYLHQLVARGHNQLYRALRFNLRSAIQTVFLDHPRKLRADRYFHVALVLFWGSFLLAAYLGFTSPGFAERAVGREALQQIEEMYAQPDREMTANSSGFMVGFYIMNNTGIGLRCVAFGLIGGVGGLFVTVSNALFIGTLFGHMATLPQRENFFTFVTAHGPFELTAIALSAAAGMRIGFGLVKTDGLTRTASLRRAAAAAMPTLSLAVFLFFGAALIEAYVSPSPLPYAVKAGLAVACTLLMLAYYFVLGHGGAASHAP